MNEIRTKPKTMESRFSANVRACQLACSLLVCFIFALNGFATSKAPPKVWVFDARALRKADLANPASARQVWEEMHVVSSLQGLVNRTEPRLYVLFCREFGVETDRFWLDWYQKEDGWLAASEMGQLATLEDCLREFRSAYRGLVVYDPKVPATSNLAATVAGCDGLLPVQYNDAPDSLYRLLVEKLGVPVHVWLVGKDGSSRFTGQGLVPDLGMASSGSAKIDAYRWAIERYLKTGRCDPAFVGYFVDSYWVGHAAQAGHEMHTLSNHDFFVARRAFFMDLSPWADEAPVDDPQQRLGLDRSAFLEILGLMATQRQGGMLKVGGFVPWPLKYTSFAGAGKHEPVPAEWEFGRLISQYNGYMEADAAGLGGISNSSFHQHYPLQPKYRQPNNPPDERIWRTRGFLSEQGKVQARFYLGHYVGDYDAPSWLYKAVPAFFPDSARGKVPLGWAFNPNLADRAPQALVYAYRNASSNDFFIAGDSGAGYLNPRALSIRPESGLPSGLSAWQKHCREYFSRWDMHITGFVLDGAAGASTDQEYAIYTAFSEKGIGTHYTRKPELRAGIPSCREQDLPDSVEEAAQVILKAAERNPNEPGFFWARSILKSPSWYAKLSELLDKGQKRRPIEVVDPYTFFGLIGVHTREP